METLQNEYSKLKYDGSNVINRLILEIQYFLENRDTKQIDLNIYPDLGRFNNPYKSSIDKILSILTNLNDKNILTKILSFLNQNNNTFKVQFLQLETENKELQNKIIELENEIIELENEIILLY